MIGQKYKVHKIVCFIGRLVLLVDLDGRARDQTLHLVCVLPAVFVRYFVSDHEHFVFRPTIKVAGKLCLSD